MDSSPNGKVTLTSDFSNVYEWLDSYADERSRGFAMVDSPVTALTCVLLYVLMVAVGPMAMKSRRPFELRRAMGLYNLSMTALSGCTAAELINAVWVFYCAKLVEFSDTLFFVLRKKESQISFLHVYHHLTVVGGWWVGVKWFPTNYITLLATLTNSFVHFWMYLYYGLASLGPAFTPSLWWKKCVTILQLAQFVFAVGVATHSTYVDCSIPTVLRYIMVMYMVSFLALFSNFYVKAYLQNKGHDLLCGPTAIALERRATGQKQEKQDVCNVNHDHIKGE